MFFNIILPFIEGVIYYQPISLILLTPPPALGLTPTPSPKGEGNFKGRGVLVTVPFSVGELLADSPPLKGRGQGWGLCCSHFFLARINAEYFLLLVLATKGAQESLLFTLLFSR